MTATDHPVPSAPSPPADPVVRDDRNVRLAWACVLSLPVLFVLLFVVGGGVTAAFGVEEQARAPFGVFALLLLTLALLFALPTLLAWRFANRAREHGDDRGKVPAIVVTVFSLAFLAQNALSWSLWFLEDTL